MHRVLISGIALAVLGFTCSRGSAEPVGGGTSFGCTVKQLQTRGASQCIAKAEYDVQHNLSTAHYVRCDRGEMECCEEVVSTGEELDCSEISSTRYRSGGGAVYVPPAGLSPGGWYSPPRRPGQYGGNRPVNPAPPAPGHSRPKLPGGVVSVHGGVKTTGGNSAPAPITIQRHEHRSEGGGHK